MADRSPKAGVETRSTQDASPAEPNEAAEAVGGESTAVASTDAGEMEASELVRVDLAALDSLDVDDLLLFLLADALPLRGVAGLVDWRLCGALSAAVADGRIACSAGEKALWPAPPSMRLRRIFLCGLGAIDQLQGEQLAHALRTMSAAARAAGGKRLAAAAPALGHGATRRDTLALQMLFVRAATTLRPHGVDVLVDIR